MAENLKEEIEDKVIDCINSGVAGRLVVFKPEKSSFVADLGVERKGKYKEGEIYFQISSFLAPAKDSVFIKDFPQENFKTDKNFYLLFVYFDKVTQKMGEHIWLIPSLQFIDIADIVKSGYPGKNLLRFETSLDVKKIDKYSKFIVDTKELGKLTLGALENNGKFDFKEENSQNKNIINLEALKEFLCDARKDTYAANASPIDNPRLLASKQFEFQKGEYFYRDIFFNENKRFIGQEIIYHDSKPIWGMNYIGNQIGKTETAFLKEALFRLIDKCRLGGSFGYKMRELEYKDQGQGNLDEFSGTEEIFQEGENIYKLNYQGGLL